MSCANAPEGQGTAEEEKVMMPRRRKVNPIDKNRCHKCKSAKIQHIIRSTPYCAPCFKQRVHIRFIRQLHPPLLPSHLTSALKAKDQVAHRPPLQSGNVLIALSGGAGSTALLDLLTTRDYYGIGEKRVADRTRGERDVVWSRGTAVNVDFSGVVHGTQDRTEEMRKLAEERKLAFVGLRAEDVFDAGLVGRLSGRTEVSAEGGVLAVDLLDRDLPLLSIPSSSTSTPLEQLQTLIASLPAASRPALLSNILSALLNLAAQSIPGISHLLLGETATRQAQRVIAGTAAGRGWALPLELTGSHTLPSASNLAAGEVKTGIVRMKPMKEVTVKEAAIYCRIAGLETMNERRWENAGPGTAGKSDLKGKAAASLEMLTEQFIAGLSVTHPSTVSTIIRTGDKLVFAGTDNDTLCPVCEMPVGPSALAWKSHSAIASLPNKQTILEMPESNRKSDGESLAKLLCYSCLTTFTPTSVIRESKAIARDPAPLPLWINNRVAERTAISRNEMKAQIAVYLIPDDE